MARERTSLSRVGLVDDPVLCGAFRGGGRVYGLLRFAVAIVITSSPGKPWMSHLARITELLPTK